MENESQIKEYIQTKEKSSILGSIDSIKDEFNSLIGKEEQETKTGLHLFEWLKNDKNLLKYAELKNKEGELSKSDQFSIKLLELKLSITCPYFEDFKEFLEELKKGEHVDEGSETDPQTSQTSQQSEGEGQSSDNTDSGGSDSQTNPAETTSEAIPETVEAIHTFCGTNLSEIQSYPFYKNSKTGVTRCSATAQMNGKNFGINLPHGDAYNAGTRPGKKPFTEALCTLPKNKENKRPSKNWPSIQSSEFQTLGDDNNFADIYVESKSNYGHRAVAFRDSTGQRYVLDPYIRVKGDLDNTPKKLEDYLSTKKIVKSHFYKSQGYNYENLSYR